MFGERRYTSITVDQLDQYGRNTVELLKLKADLRKLVARLQKGEITYYEFMQELEKLLGD